MLETRVNSSVVPHHKGPGLGNQSPFLHRRRQLARRVCRVNQMRIPGKLPRARNWLFPDTLGLIPKCRILGARMLRKHRTRAWRRKSPQAFRILLLPRWTTWYSAGSGSGLLLMVRRFSTVSAVGVSERGAGSPMNGTLCSGATDTAAPMVKAFSSKWSNVA